MCSGNLGFNYSIHPTPCPHMHCVLEMKNCIIQNFFFVYDKLIAVIFIMKLQNISETSMQNVQRSMCGLLYYITFLQLIETYSDHASSLSECYKILIQLYTIYKFMVLPRPSISLFGCVSNQLIASIMQDKNKYEQKKKSKTITGL